MSTDVFTDFDIQAYIDNELDHEDAKRVQHYIDANPQAARRYEELRKQKKILQLWWKHREH